MNEVWSFSYQKNILDRLERQKKLSWAEKIVILCWIIIWNVTAIIWVQLDFVALEQWWFIFNLARKVHKDQKSILWINIAWTVWWNQLQLLWIQFAEKIPWSVWWNQMQLLWIQFAERISWIQSHLLWLQSVEEVFWQAQGVWLQYAKNVSNSRINWLWLQNKLKK